MFQEKNDGSDGEFTSKRNDEVSIDSRSTDVFQTARDSLKNLDGIFSRFSPSMTSIQPSRKSQNDEDKGIPKNGDCRHTATQKYMAYS